MWRIGQADVRVGAGFIPSYGIGQLAELVRMLEDLEYDRIWCGNEKLYRDMWVTMGIVASQCRTLTIGTFVADPYSYHPALIAAAIATVAEAAGGRAILLLGAGGFGFKELGLERVKPAVALEESVLLIRGLLAGETVHLNGKVIHANGARLLFAPAHETKIWLASRGERVLEMAGRVADGVMIATHARPEGLMRALDSVMKGCAIAGRPMDSLATSVRVDICIDPAGILARKAVKPMIAGMLKASYPDQAFVHQAGLTIPEPLEALLSDGNFADVYAAAQAALPEEFVDAFSWAGSAEEVAQKVAAVVDSGFTELCVVPHPTSNRSNFEVLRAFAEDVLPRARALLG